MYAIDLEKAWSKSVDHRGATTGGVGGVRTPPTFAGTPPTFLTTFSWGGPILVGPPLREIALRCDAVTVMGYITLRCCVIMITWITYLYLITTTT